MILGYKPWPSQHAVAGVADTASNTAPWTTISTSQPTWHRGGCGRPQWSARSDVPDVARGKWWRMKIRKRWEGARDDPGTFSCDTRMMLPLDDHSTSSHCQVQLRLGAGTGVLASHSERTNERPTPCGPAVLLGISVSCLAVVHLKRGKVPRGACDWAHVLNVIWRSCVCFLIPKL